MNLNVRKSHESAWKLFKAILERDIPVFLKTVKGVSSKLIYVGSSDSHKDSVINSGKSCKTVPDINMFSYPLYSFYFSPGKVQNHFIQW